MDRVRTIQDYSSPEPLARQLVLKTRNSPDASGEYLGRGAEETHTIFSEEIQGRLERGNTELPHIREIFGNSDGIAGIGLINMLNLDENLGSVRLRIMHNLAAGRHDINVIPMLIRLASPELIAQIREIMHLELDIENYVPIINIISLATVGVEDVGTVSQELHSAIQSVLAGEQINTVSGAEVEAQEETTRELENIGRQTTDEVDREGTRRNVERRRMLEISWGNIAM